MLELSEEKMDITQFELKLAEYDMQLETIRFATYDNFRVLKQTDNYIEKYFPFLIQNMISQNINSFICGP